MLRDLYLWLLVRRRLASAPLAGRGLTISRFPSGCWQAAVVGSGTSAYGVTLAEALITLLDGESAR